MRKGLTLIIIVITVLFLVSTNAIAVEVAQRISDREIIEALKELKEGQKAIQQQIADTNRRIDDLKESTNKQFEQVDKRFEDMFTFLWILTGIFTALVIAVIGFGYWDRRTVIKEARREAIEFIEKEGMLRRMLDALRELSKTNQEIARVLRLFNLL